MIKKTLLSSAAAAALCALLSVSASASTKASFSPVTSADILNDVKSTDDVLTNGMGLQGQRFSPLTQINKKTVKDLVPVWNFSFGGEKQRGQESQPIIKDGVMYVTASYSRVFAIDIASGEELWQYDAKLPDAILPCCDVINRGVAIYDNLVIFGTLDAKLVALDRQTGKVVWKKKVDNYKDGYSITAAPTIVKDMVITGVAGGEFGIVGKVEARNAKTGEVVWTRPTVNIKVAQETPIRALILDEENIWHIASKNIRSFGGGCDVSSQASNSNSDFAKYLGQTKSNLFQKDNVKRLKASIFHPMETGLIFGNNPFYITKILVKNGNEILSEIKTYSAISENPRFIFETKDIAENYTIEFYDNDGNEFVSEAK